MSPNRAALIAACLDNPDDDMPRLLLSDLLEEEGHSDIGKPEWLRLAGYWGISAKSLFWFVLFSGTPSGAVAVWIGADWQQVPQPHCVDCESLARICWPVWQYDILSGKRWLCDGCYEHRIMVGSIRC